MKQKFKFLAILLGLSSAIIPLKASEPGYLKITTTDNEPVYLALADKPSVSVANDGVTVTTADDSISFIFSALPTFSFADLSHVEKVEDADSSVIMNYTDGTISLSGIIPGSIVTICDLNGRTVFSGIADQSGSWSYSVANIQTGIYIINNAKLTSKFIVK